MAAAETRRHAEPAPAAAPVADFESLGSIFLARLQSERLHLATLSASLARAEEKPGRIFDELQMRAHRLSGTASIFEATAIAAAAYTLEQAAAAAAQSCSDHADANVWASLVVLIDLLHEPQVE